MHVYALSHFPFGYAYILERKSYRLKFPWIGVVNRSQQDIDKNVDMIAARHQECEYFATTLKYKHLAHIMGSDHLAKMFSKVNIGSSYTIPFNGIKNLDDQ